MAGHNKTGRSKGNNTGQYIAIPFCVIDSPGYRNTLPIAKAVYVEINRLYNGHNNGSIAVSSRLVADLLGVHHSTVARSILQLINSGLIRRSKTSSFSQKRLASEYRLTHRACDKTKSAPTNEYKNYNKSMRDRVDATEEKKL